MVAVVLYSLIAAGLFTAAICVKDGTVSGPLAWGGVFYTGVVILFLAVVV